MLPCSTWRVDWCASGGAVSELGLPALNPNWDGLRLRLQVARTINQGAEGSCALTGFVNMVMLSHRGSDVLGITETDLYGTLDLDTVLEAVDAVNDELSTAGAGSGIPFL